MSLDAATLQRRLVASVGQGIGVHDHGSGVLRVETPLAFADGDSLVVRLRQANGGYEWSDFGHTFMHLSYGLDVDALLSGKRGELLEAALLRLGLDDRDGELVLSSGDEELGSSLLRFAQALIHVSDLDYLSQERVRSTFREDVERLLSERFGSRAHFAHVDPEHDSAGEYPIDCLLDESRRPVAVMAVGNDDQCRDATITLQQFSAWGRELFSTAIFADQEKINRRVLARFSNVCDKQFSSLAGREESIVDYLERELGGR
jgi:hypothetical protein